MNIHRFSRRIVCPFTSQLVLLVMAFLMSASPVAAAPPDAPVMAIQYFDAILGDLDHGAAAAIVSADALIHTPEGQFRGYEGAGQFAATLRNAFSSVQFVTQEPLLTGDLATVQWTMTGIHTGAWLGLEPTGAQVSVSGIAVFRFDDLAIVEQWIAYDRMSLVDQIQAHALTHSCDADCLRPRGNR